MIEKLMHRVKGTPTSGVRALKEYRRRVFFCQMLGVVGGVTWSLPAIKGALVVEGGQVEDHIPG